MVICSICQCPWCKASPWPMSSCQQEVTEHRVGKRGTKSVCTCPSTGGIGGVGSFPRSARLHMRGRAGAQTQSHSRPPFSPMHSSTPSQSPRRQRGLHCVDDSGEGEDRMDEGFCRKHSKRQIVFPCYSPAA